MIVDPAEVALHLKSSLDFKWFPKLFSYNFNAWWVIKKVSINRMGKYFLNVENLGEIKEKTKLPSILKGNLPTRSSFAF